jgi:GNAT superfamily N-acetyltransferase
VSADGIATRPARAGDDPFLSDVYASTRAEELSVVPWSDSQKRAFLQSQFDAQRRDWTVRYPDASFLVVERDGEPVGRLYVTRLGDGELRVIDIALLPEHRGHGIGTRLMQQLIDQADAEGRTLSLHVERWSPAIRLYTRLGFTCTGATDVLVRMDRPPQRLR